MRVAIIILGILGLITLALNWESVSPDPNTIPIEGSIIHVADAPTCNKCKGDYVLTNSKTNKSCTKYMCMVSNK